MSAVTETLVDFKLTLEQDFKDTDAIIQSVVNFVDNLKYELSPSCRTFIDQFEDYLSQYYDNIKALEVQVKDSTSTH